MTAQDDTILDLRPRMETPTDPPLTTGQSNTPTTQFAMPRLAFEDNSNKKTEQVVADSDAMAIAGRFLDGGRYQIVERIATGAAARVYKAIDWELSSKGRDPVYVAIKLFSPNSTFEADTDERIKIEVLATHDVHSYHVCRNYNLLILPNGQRSIVMEYIEGPTLMWILRNGYRVDYLRAARWGSQIATGLADAHKKNVVHRDLKPDNILIRAKDDSACILDFGIAKFFQDDVNITKEGVLIGTPLYMAPEQFKQSADPRADLFALGLILARLATGIVPMSGDRSQEDIYRHRVQEQIPYRLRDDAPNAPIEYAAIVDRLLALPREKRFSTGADVAAALQPMIHNADADTRQSFVAPPPLPNQPHDTGPPPPPPLPKARRIPPAKTAPLHGANIAPSARAPTLQPSRVPPLLAGAMIAVIVLVLAAIGATAHGVLKVELNPTVKGTLVDSPIDDALAPTADSKKR